MSRNINRPLSPHLQVYRPQLTSVMSILHRFCGAALTIGLVMLVWMLTATAAGEEDFNRFQWFCSTMVGRLMLIGWTFALYYHMCNGIRHLIWDTGRLFKIEHAYRAGYIVLLAAVGLTLWFWGEVLFADSMAYYFRR